MNKTKKMNVLLAVDAGLKAGLACFDETGRLSWYKSHNFGSRSRLKRGIYSCLNELPDLQWLVLEGGGVMADPWRTTAEKRGIKVVQIGAEQWRHDLLYRREQRTGAQAKQYADGLAREVIAFLGQSQPTSLRHDAAEAVLAGLWGVFKTGLLKQVPPELEKRLKTAF